MSELLLRVENLSYAYGERRALEGLSLEVRAGEALGLLGPNGAGKSTLMALATGLLEPASGRVLLAGGGDPRDPRARAVLGLAPQELALYEDLSGRENLEFFGRMQGLAGARLRERVGWSLDFAGLADRAGDRVGAYSGGMKRRLNLACALLHDPRLLLLDEPTVGVDPQSRNALLEAIEALRAEGRSILFATHYMEEAQRLCDRVAIVDHGRLLALDRVETLLAAHGGPSRLELRQADGSLCETVETDDPLTELLRRREAGPLGEFRLLRPDLERVFLHLTGRELRD
jgi:ABC-2 type transport system ATP-binding protein